MHLFFYLKNMSRFLALHFVICYTPISCKIRRHWGAIQLIHSHQSTLEISHSEKHEQCVQNVMEVRLVARPHFCSMVLFCLFPVLCRNFSNFNKERYKHHCPGAYPDCHSSYIKLFFYHSLWVFITPVNTVVLVFSYTICLEYY